MVQDTQPRFDAGAKAWAAYNERPLGRIRREVTWSNLAPHLPELVDPNDPPRILDAGGGSGELALRLAQRGYRVWLLDYAPGMVDQARHAAQKVPDEVRSRLAFWCMAVDDVPQSFAPRSFDAITCHKLIEYLPNPQSTLSTLCSLLRDGGVLSVSFVNRHAEVLRQVWARSDPQGALASLADGGFCATLFDLPGVAYTAEQVSAWLADLGMADISVYGVRTFADYVPQERLDDPAFFAPLLQLEREVASRPPYSMLARYVQLVAHQSSEPEPW
jgi:S-adenosylmethionine-dependent methyltransferase